MCVRVHANTRIVHCVRFTSVARFIYFTSRAYDFGYRTVDVDRDVRVTSVVDKRDTVTGYGTSTRKPTLDVAKNELPAFLLLPESNEIFSIAYENG